jgi:hypothetical protein
MRAAPSGTASEPATRSSAPVGRNTAQAGGGPPDRQNRDFDRRLILMCRQSGLGGSEFPLLVPGSERLAVYAIEGDEPRAAKSAGSVGFDQGGLLLRCIAEASAPVELHKGVVRSIHTTPRYQRYAMQWRKTGRRFGPRLRRFE